MEHTILDISSINGFGYSYIDWEYAKRKQKEPDITFEDILKEAMDKLEEDEEVWLKELRAYRKIDDCLRAESEGKR